MSNARPAVLADMEWIKPLADKHAKENGFIKRAAYEEAIERGELLVIEPVAFVRFHKRERDDWHTVYDLVSEQEGADHALFSLVPRPLQLKCPEGLPQNDFYAAEGGFLAGTFEGRKRKLNVWQFFAGLFAPAITDCS